MTPGESILRMCSCVDLYDGDTKVHRGGTLFLTTLRFLWMDGPRLTRPCWELSRVSGFKEEAGGGIFTKSSPKLTLTFVGGGKHLKLSFTAEGPGHKDMVAELPRALGGLAGAMERARRAQEEAHGMEEREAKRGRPQAPPPPPAPEDPDKFLVPMESLLLKSMKAEQENARVERFFSGALSSLPALAQTLTELQGIVAAAASAAACGPVGGGGGGEGGAGGSGDPAAEASIMGALLRDMGSVANPVTRDMAPGRDFAPALARQVAAFIKPRLVELGGLMPLTDVYAMYNRARGMDTISPEDLLEAVGVMGGLGLGLRLETLGSGSGGGGGKAASSANPLKVLQLDALTDDSMCKRAEQWALAGEKRGESFITPQGCADGEKLPLTVAKQHLEVGVKRGVLALDVSMAGRRYFRACYFQQLAQAE